MRAMRVALASLFAAAVAAAAGCSGSSDAGLDAAVPDLAPVVGQDATVPLFDHALFNSGAQTNDATATLPSGLFSSVILHVALDCPMNRCDQWDRIGRLYVVEPGAGGDAGDEKLIEVARFITTFGVAGAWDIDVTELQPLLSGEVALRARIDTYVSGGVNGNGWLLTATLNYTGGVPSPEPVAVLPLTWSDFPIGDPTRPVSGSLLPTQMMLPDGATGAALRVLVTGHGQGNLYNCGEFCTQDHQVTVDGQTAATQTIWKDDCDQNPINNQHGSWMYARANWCPGEPVPVWRADLGPRAAPFTVGYTTEDYVNTCTPTNCQVFSCALGTGCAFDGGNHTEPFYAFSALLIAYR